MKRNNRLRLFALLAAFVLLFTLAACGEDDVDWVTGETYATGQQSTAATTAATGEGQTTATAPTQRIEGSYPAPVFKPGRYSMINSTTTLTEYQNASGAAYYSEQTMSRYTYGLDIKTASGGGLTCAVTFDAIYITNTVDGETEVLLDTSIRDYLSVSTEPYYNIIGRSFTADIAADGSVAGLSGVEKLIAELPGSADLLDKENLTGVVGSLFYPIPNEFADGTSWTLEQYGLPNKYTLSRLARGQFEISIQGTEQQPFSYDTADGSFTVSYDTVSAMTGTMYMDTANRALQEINSVQHSSGAIFDEKTRTPFSYSVTSHSVVSAR